MSTSIEQLKDELSKLSMNEKASLIEFLTASMDEPHDPDAEALWEQELQRRRAEVEAGTADLKPADEVLKEIREQLKCQR